MTNAGFFSTKKVPNDEWKMNCLHLVHKHLKKHPFKHRFFNHELEVNEFVDGIPSHFSDTYLELLYGAYPIDIYGFSEHFSISSDAPSSFRPSSEWGTLMRDLASVLARQGLVEYGNASYNVISNLPPAIPLWPRGRQSTVLLTDIHKILQIFHTVEDFLVGWDGHEQIDEERYLVWIGIDTNTRQEFSERLLPKVWEMARRAKPGFFKYYRVIEANIPDYEKNWWFRGRPTLQFVTTDAQGITEFSGYLGPNEHVRPHDVYTVRTAFQSKQDPLGNPNKGVRVVFLDERTARAEATPLMDVGASVYYMNMRGETVLLGGPSPAAIGETGFVVR